jgi:prevent-host-death family protein
MRISVTDAKAQLTELVRRAEAGDEIVLTCHGHPAVRLVPIKRELSREARRALLEELQAANPTPGRAPRAVRTSSTTSSACRSDRRQFFVCEPSHAS